jgi:hypothetical protein
MLPIVDMMLSVILIPGGDNLLLFAGCRSKGEALRGQRPDPACFSPVFFKQGFAFPGNAVIGSAQRMRPSPHRDMGAQRD